MNLLSTDDLSQYTDEDFATVEKVVAKERKRRNKIARSKAKLEQLADNFGYTLTQRDSDKTPPAIPPVARGVFDGKLDFSKD
jgi:hypothetical protein